MSRTIDIPQELKTNLNKFRRARHKGLGAFIAKVNKRDLILEHEDTITVDKVEELAEELADSRPQYILLAYQLTHDDGRVSYPLVLINWTPSGCETGLLTLHASAFIPFQELALPNKTIEVRDDPENLTTELVNSKLLAG